MTVTFEVPAYVAQNAERRARANEPRPCGEGIGDGRTCGTATHHLLPRGYRCLAHIPPQPVPDPTRTLAALQARRAAGDST
jgi:hypothetical protein